MMVKGGSSRNHLCSPRLLCHQCSIKDTFLLWSHMSPVEDPNISFGIWEFSMIDSKTLQHLNLPATCFVISSRSQLSSASKSSCIYGVPSQGVGLDLSHELYFHSYHMRQIRFDCFNVGNVLIRLLQSLKAWCFRHQLRFNISYDTLPG